VVTTATTAVKVEHLVAAIESQFSRHLDLSGGGGTPAEQLVRSRGLAALAVQVVTGDEPQACAEAVTDGFDDNGIDAIYIDEVEPRLVLVQAKFHEAGRKTITLGEVRNVLAGMRYLTDERLDRFKGRLDRLAPQIKSVLRRPGLQIELVLAITSNQSLGEAVRTALQDEQRAMNEPDVILTFRALSLDDLHRHVLATTSDSTVELTGILENWGWRQEPYRAFYGTIPASVVAEWYEQYGGRLFDRNIRKALGRTPVNDSLVSTLSQESQHFWYFNNGITVLCKRIVKAPVGAPERRRGEFSLSGVSVVNGAQTVVSIAAVATQSPEMLDRASVWARIISLENCPDDFATRITRATNTQNRVVDLDFVSLDPTQERLRQDFALSLRKSYSIKRGEADPRPDEGCSVAEATMALACAHRDVHYAVLAHSSPGRLWDMGENGDYRRLFRADLGAREVWRWVQAMRRVEEMISGATANLHGRARAIVGQGDRVLTHVVFNMLDRSGIDEPATDWNDQLERIDDLVGRAFDSLIRHANSEFSEDYAPALFKNQGKCRRLADLIRIDLVGGASAHNRLWSSPATAPAESTEFHLSGRGASAQGVLHGAGLVVRAGSVAAPQVTPALAARYPSAVSRREWLISRGVLRPTDNGSGRLVLGQDEYFDSPSQAAAVILGRPANGRTEWRTAGGLSINQVQQATS